MDNNKIEKIANIIYNELCYMYCDNCRLNIEIDEEEARAKYGYWGCEDCHRKYNGWAISMCESENIAKEIIKALGELNET